MYTSVGLVALVGSFLSPLLGAPTWRPYDLARQEGQRTGKPLALVIGAGTGGFHALSEEGRLSRQTRKLLATKYVPVYVDVRTRAGRRLAQELAISERTGLVLSDRTGRVQAFHHDGTLAETALTEYLRRYADPSHVVRTTEQVPPEQVALADEEEGAEEQPSVPYIPVQRYVPISSGSC